MDVSKIGRFISELRREKGMTQKELAQNLGVSDRAVSKWERGINLPDAGLFEPLCGIFEITVSELLRGEREAPTLSDMELVVRDTVALAREKEHRAVNAKRLAGLCLFLALYLGTFLFLATDGPDRIFWAVRNLVDPPVETLCIPPRVELYFRESDYSDENRYGLTSHKYVNLHYVGCYYLEDSEGNLVQADPLISQSPDSAQAEGYYTVKGSELDNIYFRVEGGYGCDNLEVDVIRYPADKIGGIDIKNGWRTKFWNHSLPVPGGAEEYVDYYRIDHYPDEHYFAIVLTWGDGYYAEYPFFTTRLEE